MDIGHLVTLLRGTLQPDERADAEKHLIEVCDEIENHRTELYRR